MFYIRADANDRIATGHVMRCMSLAYELKKLGVETTFIIADKTPVTLIEQSGYHTICLDSQWDDLDQETEKMIECIKTHHIKKLLIDSYFVTESYLKQLRQYTKTIYFDDLSAFHYPVDMLVNYNNYASLDRMHEYRGCETKLYLGCSYVPLRTEFTSVETKFRTEVKKVLLTTGGSDSYNVGGQMLEYLLAQPPIADLEYHVVAGAFNQYMECLQNLSKQHSNIQIHHKVERMSELITDCDVAITAGGSTMYELCACGVPMITYSIADNQIEGVKGFDHLNIAKYCGDVRASMQAVLDNAGTQLQFLCRNSEHRQELSKKMKCLVDGYGAKRLANAISEI